MDFLFMRNHKGKYYGVLPWTIEHAVGRMPSSGMLCHVALVRTDLSEELSASIIRVTGICELATDACCKEIQNIVLHFFIACIGC
jgi:hypothetical protein